MNRAVVVACVLAMWTGAHADGVAKDIAAIDRDIAANPKAAGPHARRAERLLGVGATAAARKEAALAVKLEPKSALAWMTQGYVLRVDSIGRDAHAGFDRKGALAAYAKALALQPDISQAAEYIAWLTELDNNGELSFAPADLAAAEKAWRAAVTLDKRGEGPDELALARVLLREGKLDDAAAIVRTVPASIERDALNLALKAVRDAKQAHAFGLTVRPSKERGGLYAAAFHELAAARQYKANYELGVENGDVKLGTPQAALFANVHASAPPRSLTDPLVVVREAVISALEPEGSPAPFDSKQTREDILESARAFTQSLAEQPRLYVRDLVRSSMPVTLAGSTKTLWRVEQEFSGAKVVFYVARIDGRPEVVGTTGTVQSVARHALRLFESGNRADARTLITWLSADVISLGASEPTLFDVWGSTQPSDDDSLETALAVLAWSSDPRRVIPVVEKCPGKFAAAHDYCRAARAASYIADKRWRELEAIAREQTANAPAQATPAAALIFALTRQRRLEDAEAAYKTVLTTVAKLPAVHEHAAGISIMRGDLAEAERRVELAVKDKDAGPGPFANGAWFFVGAQRNFNRGLELLATAEQLLPNDPSVLNTRAALEAANGDLAAAYRDALQTMELRGSSELEDGDRFVLGSIYEQLGLVDDARAMYKPIIEENGPFFTLKSVAADRLKRLAKH